MRGESAWHLYVARTPGYHRISDGSLAADMQRIDMGIAMCHWQLAACSESLSGTWRVEDPGIVLPNELTEYVVSWDEDATRATL